MAGRIDPELGECAPEGPVPAILHRLAMCPHRRCRPAGIARLPRQPVPIAVGRRDEDHGIVRGAAPDGGGARIIDQPVFRLGIGSRHRRIVEMAYPKRPVEAGVFRSEGMEGRHFVIGPRASVRIGARIGPGFDDEHAHACLRQPSGDGAPGRTRADDDIVVVGLGMVGRVHGLTASSGRRPALSCRHPRGRVRCRRRVRRR